MKVVVIIPARYGSTRFEAKPLALIAGKPMIQRVYERAAAASSVTGVAVATDDERIVSAVEKFGGKAVMTSDACRSGTDRVFEAGRTLGLTGSDIVVNVQGDQPVFDPECIDEVTAPLIGDPGTGMTTLAFAIVNEREMTDPKDVKMVFDQDGWAFVFFPGDHSPRPGREHGVRHIQAFGRVRLHHGFFGGVLLFAGRAIWKR